MEIQEKQKHRQCHIFAFQAQSDSMPASGCKEIMRIPENEP